MKRPSSRSNAQLEERTEESKLQLISRYSEKKEERQKIARSAGSCEELEDKEMIECLEMHRDELEEEKWSNVMRMSA